MKKTIWFVVVLVAIVGAIIYLEAVKVHPGGGSGAAQSVAITATPGANASSSASTMLAAIAAADQKAGDQPAVEIVDPTGFINVSSTFTLSSLIGKKVILLDFWTYSCINCIRTLPYLTAWYQKYQSQGLVVVGIHTPEFEFEKNINNVEAAVKQYGITYPVILDSNYGTWQAYGNLYWPHEYLIDMAGYIVHDQIGEGNYAETESVIQRLLAQRAQVLGGSPASVATGTVTVAPANLSEIESPETYFGAERNEYLANGTQSATGTQDLAAPASTDISLNHLYLAGDWDFEDQYATNQSAGAKVFYEYDAAKVYIVASGAASGTTVQVLQDGQPVTTADAGSDVKNGILTVTGSRLYSIINNADGGGVHTLELIVNNPGLEAFTFTFG